MGLFIASQQATKNDLGRVLQLFDLCINSRKLAPDFFLPPLMHLVHELLSRCWVATAHRIQDVVSFMFIPAAKQHWQLHRHVIDFFERLPDRFAEGSAGDYLTKIVECGALPKDPQMFAILETAYKEACRDIPSAQRAHILSVLATRTSEQTLQIPKATPKAEDKDTA